MSSIKEELEEEESEFTSKLSTRKVEQPKPTINRQQLIEASRTLGGLFHQIESQQDKTYTSSSCVIKSIFEHSLEEVNKTKQHRLTEARSEVEENIKALLEPKKLSFS